VKRERVNPSPMPVLGSRAEGKKRKEKKAKETHVLYLGGNSQTGEPEVLGFYTGLSAWLFPTLLLWLIPFFPCHTCPPISGAQ